VIKRRFEKMDEMRIAERVTARVAGRAEEYEKYFEKKLEKWNVSSPAEIPEDKKDEFFEEVDKGWQGEGEKKEAARSREAAAFWFSWKTTFRDGGGEYRAHIPVDSSKMMIPDFEKAFDKAAREMYRRLEKAGLEFDEIETVETGRGSVVIFQDEVYSPDGPVTEEQINILKRG
jgi:hypothetical protein